MGRATSVIEINGASYDAATGSAIGSKGHLAPVAVIDGFIRKSKPHKLAKSVPKAKKTESLIKPRPSRAAKVSAKAVHHRTERSKTLFRGGVDKPAIKIKSAVQTITRPVSSKLSLEAGKASRAAQITKHAAVRRFGSASSSSNSRSAAAKPVRVRPRVTHAAANAPAASITSSQTLERMLDEALITADAHKQTLKQQRYSHLPFKKFFMWSRWIQAVIILAVIVIVGLLIVWRYVPQVSVNLVAHKAHVNATVPNYVPTGYNFKKASSLPSGVSIQYQDKANAANSYTIEQTKSSADSASTAANNISKDSTVQTSQVNGNTVYIYGNQNDAMWVNNGIEYTIKNDAGLNSEQLLHIVRGL